METRKALEKKLAALETRWQALRALEALKRLANEECSCALQSWHAHFSGACESCKAMYALWAAEQ